MENTPFYADTNAVLAAMRLGVDYVFEIKCRDFVVPVRPLSVSETLQVASEVARDFSTLKNELKTNVHEAYLIALFTLQRASRIPFDSKIEGPLSKGTIDRFTVAELLALFEQYRDGCERVNPAIEELPAERLKELAEFVKKNGSIPTSLSRTHLERLALFFMTNADSPTDK